MSKWVQHMSGHGDKWELSCDAAQISNNKRDHWRIPFEKYGINFLPKSEYVECSPPEAWVDVTAECEVGDNSLRIIQCDGEPIIGRGCYRLRKIKDMYNISYFIVERRKL